MRAPKFWTYGQNSPWQHLLAPLACVYNTISSKRALRPAKWRAPVPVVCIGNLSMGGAGKTPTVQALASLFISQGKKPIVLSRGYGGSVAGPVMVEDHSADQVGDEPLMLSKTMSVCVSRDRVAGARICVEQGADIILMDDGFQNPDLYKDFSILVVDGGYGHGNEAVFPAGPLREEMKTGLKRADAVIILGRDETGTEKRILDICPDLNVFHGRIEPIIETDIAGTNVIPFAGIGRPEKFFDTVAELGGIIKVQQAFDDHHTFKDTELKGLEKLSQDHSAQLVTTEKDAMRLPEAFKDKVNVLKIALVWDDPDMIKKALSSFLDG